MLVTANIFQPLIDVFEAVLKFFHNSGGFGWGVSIVLLTVAVRALLVPLTFRQIKSMVRMQALAPQMKEIQAKYKQDKERQSQEMMKFYRENNVNPLGSCLPLVLQLPVFISLYYMLRKSLRSDICPKVQLAYQHTYAAAHHISVAAAHGQTTACGGGHGASFLFIPDLTDKASGVVLVVLIILYVGSQLGSTLVMSAAATMDPMQRRLMLFLPLVFVLFVFRFPAGVLVYWITTNLWTMAQQYVVRKRVGPRMAVAGAGDVEGTAGPPTTGKPKGSGARSAPNATKALPKPKPEPAQGNGGARGPTGGLGSLFRGRAQPAEQGDGAANGSGNGASESGSGSPSRSGSGSGSGSPSRSGSGSGSRSRSGSRSGSGKSSGASKGSGSAKGSGSSSGPGGSSNRPGGAKPPPSPRKRKKRSGRRR
jgi:YidC/Oxa1 family membrane protein insertase